MKSDKFYDKLEKIIFQEQQFQIEQLNENYQIKKIDQKQNIFCKYGKNYQDEQFSWKWVENRHIL